MNPLYRFIFYTLVIIAAWFAFTPPRARAAEGDWWGVATLTSYHYDRSKDHNEKNLGVGFEYHGKSVGWAGGFYKNSTYKTSVYAGPVFNFANAGQAKFNLCLCGVTGYEDAVQFTPLPTIAFEGKEWGVNIGVMPVMVGLQVKRRF